jgi:hypothetical protein
MARLGDCFRQSPDICTELPKPFHLHLARLSATEMDAGLDSMACTRNDVRTCTFYFLSLDRGTDDSVWTNNGGTNALEQKRL